MAGIIFTDTVDLQATQKFYIETLGFTSWLEQENIAILRHENFLIGFQAKNNVNFQSLLTIFVPTKTAVDEYYHRLKALNLTISEPQENHTYHIYNFFAKDGDGRNIEVQKFLNPIQEFSYSVEQSQ